MLRITPASHLIDFRRVQRCRRGRNFACSLVLSIAASVLIGWAIDSPLLMSIVPGAITMKVNSAICLGLLGVAMVGLSRRSRRWSIVVIAASSIVALMSLATLAEYAFGVDLRIDNFLFLDRTSALFPGRNSPLTNACLLGLVFSYFLLHSRRAILAGQVLLLVVSAAPLMTLGGYLYHVPAMFQSAPYPVVALNTSVALMLLCLGGLLDTADRGLMSIIISNSHAGMLARRLLPAAAGLPLLTGLLVLAGQRAGLYTGAFGSAMLAASCSIFFAGAVCLTIAHLWNAEVVQLGVEAEQRRLLDAERSARAQAEESDRLKNEFLSVVSHELRTPLTAILGWAQLLQRDTNRADLDTGLEIIVDNAQAQRQIIADLLDMGRIISGKLRLQDEPVDLERVAEAATESVRAGALAKDIRLEFDSTLAGQRVSGDPNRLQQVVWNLLSNAIKFTGRGGLIRVRTADVGDNVELSITDSGCGISPEFLPFVFERFRQADSSTSRQHGGLGLGLSIVKQLIELHGGTVRARSRGKGAGSSFSFTLPKLPLRALSVAEVPSAPVLQMPSLLQSNMLENLHILVVDDEPHMRGLIKRELETAKATVETAASSDEAIELLRGGQFNILISDIGMPNEDGYALIRRVRALGSSGALPAIALTAYVREEDRVRALEAGFQQHLGKPFEPEQLLSIVAATVSTKTDRRAG